MKQKLKQFFSRISLQTIIIAIVTLTIFISLISTSFFIQDYVVKNEYTDAKDKMETIAKIFATNEQVKEAIMNDEQASVIQNLSLEVAKLSDLDFIVVLDKDLIRLSHPDSSAIGKPFSNIEDATKALNGTEHFSTREGVLGDGLRFFVPVKDDEGNIIGVICAGMTISTIDAEMYGLQKRISLGLLLGLAIGIIGAIISSKTIKSILFGLEPKDIASMVTEKNLINDEINEGIIAIDQHHTITLANHAAKYMLHEVDINLVEQTMIDEDIFNLLFRHCFNSQKKETDQEVTLHHLSLIASISPIFNNKVFNGAVVTFRDQSEMTQLMHTLSGSQQYIDALRAQTHEFMNKTHVIMGLIEQKDYNSVQAYIKQISHDYKKEVGFVTDMIKSPAIAGFIIGKINEASEQDVTIILDNQSFLPELAMTDTIHEVVQILGSLIDNAIDATKGQMIKQINLFILYESEGDILIIEVKDTGQGILTESSDMIFQKGFSTKGENRGYGLSALSQIMKQHDGTIDIQPNKPHGTIFYIELPGIKKGAYNENTYY